VADVWQQLPDQKPVPHRISWILHAFVVDIKKLQSARKLNERIRKKGTANE
jgi:hypothetical protein